MFIPEMMDKIVAGNIGARKGIAFAAIGIFCSYVVMVLLSMTTDPFVESLFWITGFSFWLVTVSISTLLMCGYFFGRLAGIEILTKGKGKKWVGVKYSVLTLWIGVIIGSTSEFVRHEWRHFGTGDWNINELFFDYYFKSLFWITIVGILPAILIGVWFGIIIEKKRHSPK